MTTPVYTIDRDAEGILQIYFYGELSLAIAQELAQKMHAFLDDQPEKSVPILAHRIRPMWMPIEAQILLGRLLRHSAIKRIAIIGLSASGGMVSEFVSRFSHRAINLFEREEDARSFLMAPMD